jgi:hypothetical protein
MTRAAAATDDKRKVSYTGLHTVLDVITALAVVAVAALVFFLIPPAPLG